MITRLKIGVFRNQKDRISKMNNLIWTGFSFVQDVINVLLICKFQDHPIKSELVMLMIMPNISLFFNQGDTSH